MSPFFNGLLELELFLVEDDLLHLVFIGPTEREDLGARLCPGTEPVRLVGLWILGSAHLDPRIATDPTERPRPPRDITPIHWDSLEQRLDEEEAEGFSGVVLVVRGGAVVFSRGYGLANREKSIRNSPDTVFAIGSVPIDFTKAGLLLLLDAGLVRMDETLPEFFDDVPADKRSITVGHQMQGLSGLQDFHDRPEDRDPDHSWIDRDEAVRRILSQELLFPPGSGRAHSHSACGLLAAMIEIRSGESYQDFTRNNLFEPAGMHSTGFNGDAFEEERLALAYDAQSDGDPNVPPPSGSRLRGW